MCYIPAVLDTSVVVPAGALSAPPTSLFSGVSQAASRALGVRNYLREPDSSRLQQSPPSSAAAAALTRAVHEVIVENFHQIPGRPGSENWRKYKPWPSTSVQNKSAEVLLERALIRACIEAQRKDWWNQVPAVSGLFGPNSGRRCAIDLVHERAPSAFDFIELKVASNTVVYATIEVLQYGFAWLLSRQPKNKQLLGYPDGTLLDGNDVALSVLAPAPFYGKADWKAFSGAVDRTLAEIARAEGATMAFRLEHFRSDFDPCAQYDGPSVCALFDRREPR